MATASFLASTAAPTPPVTVPAVDLSLGQLLLNLVIVLGALGLLAWVAMALMRGRGALPVGLRAKGIRVEDRLPIDPQRALLVVGVGRRRWLVGMTQAAFNPIAELDAEAPATFEESLRSEL